MLNSMVHLKSADKLHLLLYIRMSWTLLSRTVAVYNGEELHGFGIGEYQNHFVRRILLYLHGFRAVGVRTPRPNRSFPPYLLCRYSLRLFLLPPPI